MAVAADAVVVDLIATTDKSKGALTRYVSDFESGADRAVKAAGSIERAGGQASNAARNLGFQLSDIGTQVAGGTSPFIIISQQAPQVLQALQDMTAAGATLGSTLRTIALPGFLALASVAYTLAQNLYKGADAADTKKKAVDSLKDAVDRLNGSAALANHTTEIGIQDDINAAVALRAREVQTRRQIQAELELAKSRLSAAQVSEKYNPVGIPGQGASSRAVDVADLTRQIAEQNVKIAEADKAIRSGQGQLVLKQVAAAADAATAATTRYSNEIDRLTRKFEAGGFGSGKAAEEAFREQAKAATDARDATLKAISDGKRAQSRANSEALAEARRFAKEQAKIMAEATSDPTEDLIKDNRSLLRSLGIEDADKELKGITDEIEKMQKARVDAQGKAIEDGQRKQEESLRTLSGLYYDLFSRGTKGLWADFKEMGLRALAELAAKKTFALITDIATGGATGGLGGIVSSLFGRASGGYSPGGRMIRINEGASPGRVEGFVPNGGGKVIPLGQMGAAMQGGGTTIVNQSFHLDARYGLTTPQLLSYVNDTASRAAAGAGAASFKAGQAAAPGRIQKLQQLGS
jgi:hypothetical protein